MQVLANLASAQTMPAIGRELDTYLRSPRDPLVCLAVRAAARCACRVPAVAERCLQSLLVLLSSGSDETVGEVVNAVRHVEKARLGSDVARHSTPLAG